MGTSVAKLLTPELVAKVERLRGLIDDAYDLYLKHDPMQHHKSAEGQIDLSLGTTFARRDGRTRVPVQVYSYVFGPSRTHWFDDIDEALDAVEDWVAGYRDYLLCGECSKPKTGGNGWDIEAFCETCQPAKAG